MRRLVSQLRICYLRYFLDELRVRVVRKSSGPKLEVAGVYVGVFLI
jgi:hypothetical protein